MGSVTKEGDGGITERELQASYEGDLTQPSCLHPREGISCIARVQDTSKSLKTETLASRPGTQVLRNIRDAYLFFRIYLKQLSVVLLTLLVAALGCALRGDMVLIAHLSYKTITTTFARPPVTNYSNCTSYPSDTCLTSTGYEALIHDVSEEERTLSATGQENILPAYLQLPDSYNLPDLLFYILISIATSEVSYHTICGFLQVYFYILKRAEPETWKCQPQRFLTRSNEVHEIVVGTTNMFVAGAVSGFLTCWIKSGNYNTLYFRLDEFGYPYLVFSVVALFLWLEATAYYIHAMLHLPFFYKTLHKHHHRYHSPTAYSAVSMSPIELSFLDIAIIAPLFLVPINAMVFSLELAYIYYFGLMDHSGVMMESWFPWQPHTKFHDDHHRYFHCNFGFNTYLFDRLHGTLRKKGRIYGEKIFGGRGIKEE